MDYTKQIFYKRNHYSLNLFFDLLAFFIIIAILIFIAWGTRQMVTSVDVLRYKPVTLEYINLIPYSLRTILRMLIAMCCSLVFTFTYATLAVINTKLEQILIPILDILQSVPILGYISFTVTAFLAIAPSTIIGAECAAIFAIFSSQAWNITFSFYHALKTIPIELSDTASIFKVSRWRRFWQMEVPYAIPGLCWNIVVSMSSGWFFVVASEVIVVGDNKITLPGIGSYISLAIQNKNFLAMSCAIIAMSVVIILYDQLLLRPLVAWSDKFRYEMTITDCNIAKSWVFDLFQRTLIIKKLFAPLGYIARFFLYLPILNRSTEIKSQLILKDSSSRNWFDNIWYMVLFIAIIIAITYSINFLYYDIGWSEFIKVFILALITLLRVITMITIASFIWIPIGIYIGLNPKLTAIIQPLIQFLAAFPANILFPIMFIFISHYHLNPNIWLSFLMIMGSQWYILFNVIAGASSIPSDLRDVITNLNIRGWYWWFKVMLPAITPYFIIGVITASGGAWNASIVAEVINFGDQKMIATGLGSYIAEMTTKADFNKIVLGIGMMSLFVVLFNRFLWNPLSEYSIKRFSFKGQ